jgi:Flp pilus assembly protein TadD
LPQAEAAASKALAQDPSDSKHLALLGIVKVRQSKFDEAMDPLTRSVKANPGYALAQNYLGIALTEKGQREAAEAAFRKAVQIAPDYANAHHNLAFVYATQDPPFIELAKYHYQKAIAGGEPRNEALEKLIEGKK